MEVLRVFSFLLGVLILVPVIVSGGQPPPPSAHQSSLVLSVGVVDGEERRSGVVVRDDGRSGHGVNGVVGGQRCVPDDTEGAAADLGGRAGTGEGG